MRWIPNALTTIRLLLTVPLAYSLWVGDTWLALGLLSFAAISDLADGFLAREFNLRTKVGAWLDPVADKTLITTVLVTLTLKGRHPSLVFLDRIRT